MKLKRDILFIYIHILFFKLLIHILIGSYNSDSGLTDKKILAHLDPLKIYQEHGQNISYFYLEKKGCQITLNFCFYVIVCKI